MPKTSTLPLAAAVLIALAAVWWYRDAPTPAPAAVGEPAATIAARADAPAIAAPASRDGAALRSPAARPRAAELEARFVADGKFSAAAALSASHSQRSFDALLSALKDGFYTDPEAIEVSALFQRQIATALAEDRTGIALRQLACGQNLCAAQLEGAAMPPLRLLETLMRSNRDGAAKIQTSSIKQVPPAPGGEATGYRIVFSTDPAVSTIVAAPRKP